MGLQGLWKCWKQWRQPSFAHALQRKWAKRCAEHRPKEKHALLPHQDCKEKYKLSYKWKQLLSKGHSTSSQKNTDMAIPIPHLTANCSSFLPPSQLRHGVLSQGWICQTSNSSHWVSLCFCQPAWKAATGVFQLALFSNVWFLIPSPAMHELFVILTWRSIKCTFLTFILTFIHKLPWRHRQLCLVEDCKFRLGLDEAEGDSPGKIQGKTTTDF